MPPNLIATAQPIESNENKMSCRGQSPAASFTQRRNAVAPKAFEAVLGEPSLGEGCSAEILGSTRGWDSPDMGDTLIS